MVWRRGRGVRLPVGVGDAQAQRRRVAHAHHLRLEGHARHEAGAEPHHGVVVHGRLDDSRGAHPDLIECITFNHFKYNLGSGGGLWFSMAMEIK